MMTQKAKLVAILAVIIVMLSGCDTASMERYTKDSESNLNGGLSRTLKVYSQTGELIKAYEIGRAYDGKFDIDPNTVDGKVKFDLNGKRTIIYNALVIVDEN